MKEEPKHWIIYKDKNGHIAAYEDTWRQPDPVHNTKIPKNFLNSTIINYKFVTFF